jgi:hypothetical protein
MSSERRIHSAASDVGGSANARGGVLLFGLYPPGFTKMAEFAVEKALSGEGTPKPPNFRELMLR